MPSNSKNMKLSSKETSVPTKEVQPPEPPEPKSKKMCHCRMKLYTSMCLASVQEKCNSNNGDVCCDQYI